MPKVPDTIQFAAPVFARHFIENGGLLPSTPQASACWYYYVMARKRYEKTLPDAVLLEEVVEKNDDYRQLLTSCAKLYGVEPELLTKQWFYVDEEIKRLKMPDLPEKFKYRKLQVIK